MPKLWLWLLSAALLQGVAHGDQILIGLTSQVWRYEQSGTDLSNAGWQNPAYDDSSWLIGRGVFAYETSSSSPGLSANVYPYTNTVLALGPVTHYFRTHFEFNGDPSQAVLVASNLVDDGSIIYLNGVEVDAYNMNASRTLAAQAGPQGEGTYIVRDLCFPSGTLRNGNNLLAVAVYQNSPTTSDVVWGTVLHLSTGYAPRI